MCQAGTGLRETRATRSALTFAPAGGLAELPVLSPRRTETGLIAPKNRDRSYLPGGTETGLASPREGDRSYFPKGGGPGLGQGSAGGELSLVVDCAAWCRRPAAAWTARRRR